MEKHQTMAFVQGSGTATLSPLNYIFFKESSRPNHKDWWHRLQKSNFTFPNSGWLDVSQPFYLCRLHSWQTHTHISLVSRVKRTIVHHAITMFFSHLINFISYINHDSLTFIVEVMGWSCGLRDSSCGDKCCYLLRARINTVLRKTEGGLDRRKKTGHGAWEPQRGGCAATNVRLNKSMSTEWWMIDLHSGFDSSFPWCF